MSVVVEDRPRIAEIDRYQVLMDPPPSDLQAMVEIAAQIARVPMATINLITQQTQHQVATYGFTGATCAREESLCSLVVNAEAPVIVRDASTDPRFRDHPYVSGDVASVRFFASHQLTTPTGVRIGTLCVFDERPHTISDAQGRALLALADRVVDVLELELRTRELQRSNEHLAAFASQVSHDLRNPLTAVTMSLAMLGAAIDPVQDAHRATLVERALGGVGRMENLIDDLLRYARLGGALERGPVDLAEILDDVVEDLAVPLADATLVAGYLPTVTGDASQLRAVLQNLIANAAKFTRDGEPAHIEVEAMRGDGCWRVEVRDRGRGVPERDRERVFEPLERVDEDTEGSGIGLSTCRRIVTAHGGRIGLADAPYGGICAWFELPD